MAYPVTVSVQPSVTGRNRFTVALRLILAIPHIILVGGIGFSAVERRGSDRFFDNTFYGGEFGILGAIVIVLAVVAWFTIVIVGRHFPGIRQFTAFYMRWRLRVLAYIMLLVDQYPPFGDSDYPAAMTLEDPPAARNRLTVAFRVFLGIPHFFLLTLLCVAWWITAVIAWILILATGQYPQGLYDFGVGVLRWYMRVEAYMLLMVDEYPPFSLS
jgi:Domain of unknown function (DUF4389)